jgi:hypothetical protein
MDDRLQRRLRDADPLTATAGRTPDPERLDAIKERIMQAETHAEPGGARSHLGPRALGFTALTATALVAILIAGTLVRPSSTVLAWAPSPTAVSPDQRAAAAAACASGLATAPGIPGGPATGADGGPASAPGGPVAGGAAQDLSVSGGSVTSGGGAVAADGGIVTVGGPGGPVPSLPSIPTVLPPLVTLEMHGTGGVAVFADDTTTAYCLLVQRDDRLVSGALLFPDLGDGTAAGVGTIGGDSGQGATIGVIAGGADGWLITRMSTTYDGRAVGIIAGRAPTDAATIAVAGGAADGATASVAQGRFALWAPGDDAGKDVTITAFDAAGHTVGQRTITAAPDAPVVTSTTAP